MNEIREAFQKKENSINDFALSIDWWILHSKDDTEFRAFIYDMFSSGYKAAQEETERLKSIIDKMYESRFEPDKLDIYRRQAK